ncbi:hypothetical protein [Bradyrhizobium canariense]|uniref:hypothetical protein n=1 Tax=Bradyrhizobium canariense TaxID=255045 RepID=UPI0032E406CC
MGRKPALQFLERSAAGGIRHARPAELHLVSRTLEEHHELASNLHGNLTAHILLDQSQCEIESCRDPSRSA